MIDIENEIERIRLNKHSEVLEIELEETMEVIELRKKHTNELIEYINAAVISSPMDLSNYVSRLNSNLEELTELSNRVEKKKKQIEECGYSIKHFDDDVVEI